MIDNLHDEIAQHLAKIYRQVRRIEEAAASSVDPATPLPIIYPEAWVGQPVPSRLESVNDAISGLDYAAWSIGQTLMSIGGMTLAGAVFDRFEEVAGDGTRPSSWLDHRWNGISSGEEIWSS